eukprot:6850051-Alexandrium_andersonii.AAC.1
MRVRQTTATTGRRPAECARNGKKSSSTRAAATSTKSKNARNELEEQVRPQDGVGRPAPGAIRGLR